MAAAYKQTHARILLMSDESRSDGGMKDADITSALGVGQSTVERIRKGCVEEGVESALNRKKQLRRRQKRLDGEGEARLIAMACGEPPEGRASWTLKLLADQLVECEIVGTISTETVRQALKKNELKPWLKQSWCIPPGQSAEFVCAMEDVLEVYQRPYDGNEVLVCMDETSKQQVRRRECRVPQRRLIGGIRLRIRAQWSEQPVHAVCTVGRMAPSRGQRASHEGGLGACDKETGRRGLP